MSDLSSETGVLDANPAALTDCRGSSPVVMVDEPGALDVLFDDATRLVALRRPPLPEDELRALTARRGRCVRTCLSPDVEVADLASLLGLPVSAEAPLRLAEAIRLFADLSGADQVGLRLAVEDRPSCPRFHVDRVALRAVCVWFGPTTEWIDEADLLDRGKLGHGAGGLADERSGLLRPGALVQRLPLSALAFFKGEPWPGMRGRALVHRSPDCAGRTRVMWTLDAVD
jgi:hypothetical protein